jgi:hypothetical protein
MYDNKFGKNFLFSVWTYGAVELQFQHMRLPPFSGAEKRKELAHRLALIEGVSIPETALNRRPSFKLSVLLGAGNLEKFMAAFDRVLFEIKKMENKQDSDPPGDRPESSDYGTPA